MLQIVRLGDQYINLAHVLGVTFGVHVWDDDEEEQGVPLAIVTMDVAAASDTGEPGWHTPVTYRFYGATALTLRAWLDERTTVIAEDVEQPPAPEWHMGRDEDEDEDDLNAEAEGAAEEIARDVREGSPRWAWDSMADIPF